jgi:hypothetical protein
LRLGGNARPFHRSHLLIQDCYDPPLLLVQGDGEREGEKFIILDSALPDPSIAKVFKNSGYPLKEQLGRQKAWFQPFWVNS